MKKNIIISLISVLILVSIFQVLFILHGFLVKAPYIKKIERHVPVDNLYSCQRISRQALLVKHRIEGLETCKRIYK